MRRAVSRWQYQPGLRPCLQGLCLNCVTPRRLEMEIAFLFLPCSQCRYSSPYKAKDPETAEIMQLCTAKTRLGMKMADTHSHTHSLTHRLTPKETGHRHSHVNIYILYCVPYTQHPLLRVGILTPSQGSTLHNSFCRRAKAKNRE